MDKYGYKAWPRTVVEDDDRMQQSHGQDHTQTEGEETTVECHVLGTNHVWLYVSGIAILLLVDTILFCFLCIFFL